MPDRHVDVLICGAGAAGAACAEALRAGGFGGSVLLAGREADPPYERPPVSKDYLRGETSRDATFLHPAEWWAERDVELVTRTSVMKLDPDARAAKLSSREEVGFGRALLATGANVRRLRVPGAELEGIHHLRALGNADSLRADAQDAEHVVLVGGSYIACEVATSLAQMGKRCTLVMQEELPLSAGFGQLAGRFVAGLLEERGIAWLGGDALERFEGEGRIHRVVTARGHALDADLVVMGTGAVPDVMLARAAGLELGETGGVACSSRLETSAAGVWAAGDMCEYASVVHGRRVRIEHWEAARDQGRAVAAAMLGEAGAFAEVPYFWSDLARCCKLEYVGPAAGWDDEVVRGDPADGRFTIFYLAGGRVVAALTAGRPDDLAEARRMIKDGTELAGRAPVLGDESTELAAL
jgi:3-phenylpropionate/trans-cinnamate dioxygenase ferredoxin reductase subunit